MDQDTHNDVDIRLRIEFNNQNFYATSFDFLNDTIGNVFGEEEDLKQFLKEIEKESFPAFTIHDATPSERKNNQGLHAVTYKAQTYSRQEYEILFQKVEEKEGGYVIDYTYQNGIIKRIKPGFWKQSKDGIYRHMSLYRKKITFYEIIILR